LCFSGNKTLQLTNKIILIRLPENASGSFIFLVFCDMKHLVLAVGILAQSWYSLAQNIHIMPVTGGPATSYRGLSVLNDSTAWLGGSKGWIAFSNDGGRHFTYKQVSGYEQCDFRSVYAFSAGTVIIANAGSPAYILRTTDTGKTWQKVYENKDSLAFIDGLDFWNKRCGIVYGDPIAGSMLLLSTKDGGKTWHDLPIESRPALQKGEASFAASGTTIRTVGNRQLCIATGGTVSRLWHSRNRGRSWKSIATPISQGKASTGIFSFTVNKKHITIVGGDYLNDTATHNNSFYSNNSGMVWMAPQQPPNGYRECVNYISDGILLACGPGGIDLSGDGGNHWYQSVTAKGYHVCKRARKGALTIIAGANGQISVLTNFEIVAD
jgi:photosystem II stability/assembly factor-like uncharacterized protein